MPHTHEKDVQQSILVTFELFQHIQWPPHLLYRLVRSLASTCGISIGKQSVRHQSIPVICLLQPFIHCPFKPFNKAICLRVEVLILVNI